MAKVLIIDKYENGEVNNMDYIPRLGDTIPIFYQPYPRVVEVVWFPERIKPELKAEHIHVLIVVE